MKPELQLGMNIYCSKTQTVCGATVYSVRSFHVHMMLIIIIINNNNVVPLNAF